MHKKIIQTDDYTGKDRRNNFPPLTGNIKSWLPILIPVLGVSVSVGMYISLVSSTAVLAKNTECEVRVNEIASRNRDEKLIDHYNENKARIIKLEEAYKYIQTQIPEIKDKLDKVLTKIEYR